MFMQPLVLPMVRFRFAIENREHPDQVIETIRRPIIKALAPMRAEIGHDDSLAEALRQIRLIFPRECFEAGQHSLVKHIAPRSMQLFERCLDCLAS